MTAPPKALLEVVGIRRSFGKIQAVDGVSFTLYPGQICAFIGPNGAGKTTTLRMCATLELPDDGDIFIDGFCTRLDPAEARKHVGFMSDAWSPDPNLSVRDYLDFEARAWGISYTARKRAVEHVVDFTGISGFADRPCEGLSKGMRQRVALAGTLLHGPKLLILDEPAEGLDPRARIELRELLRTLGSTGTAVLISSHILSELSEICDSVVMLEQGKLKTAGEVKALSKQVFAQEAIQIRCLAGKTAVEQFLLAWPGVERVSARGDGIVAELGGGDAEKAKLLKALVEAGLEPIEFVPIRGELEDLFLAMTEGKLQ
jgi:ABC-2 type transport system ATP-binding protein